MSAPSTTFRYQVCAQDETVTEREGGFGTHEAAKRYGLKRCAALNGKWVSVSAELDDAAWTRYRPEVTQ